MPIFPWDAYTKEQIHALVTNETPFANMADDQIVMLVRAWRCGLSIKHTRSLDRFWSCSPTDAFFSGDIYRLDASAVPKSLRLPESVWKFVTRDIDHAGGVYPPGRHGVHRYDSIVVREHEGYIGLVYEWEGWQFVRDEHGVEFLAEDVPNDIVRLLAAQNWLDDPNVEPPKRTGVRFRVKEN